MDDDCECEECEAGAPAWLATFADLMSLLMCFFVLLLSFSEMDIQKYKQVAGSMKFAFGVQRKIEADTIPRGTSVVKQEFSPGVPTPSAIPIMEQQTVDDSKDELKVNASISAALADLLAEVEEGMQAEIDGELVEILLFADSVMLRVREADAFPSGSAQLQSGFLPVLDKLEALLEQQEDSRVIVSGHTDNVPISNSVYPSNWVLSAARAASVVHYLSEVRTVDPGRIEIRAFADTRPVAENNSPEERARNRRIEISISVPEDEY